MGIELLPKLPRADEVLWEPFGGLKSDPVSARVIVSPLKGLIMGKKT